MHQRGWTSWLLLPHNRSWKERPSALGLVRQQRNESRSWINPGQEWVDPLAVTHSLGGFNSLAEPIPLLLFVVRLARDESRAENLITCIHIQTFNWQKCIRGNYKSATSVNSSDKEYKSASAATLLQQLQSIVPYEFTIHITDHLTNKNQCIETLKGVFYSLYLVVISCFHKITSGINLRLDLWMFKMQGFYAATW